ncbi:hypothetical protein TNCV_3362631 [Trichonephila clavipes]|nr:hypothetical protein TNCV_3362631 [Trichonephila clavipes]
MYTFCNLRQHRRGRNHCVNLSEYTLLLCKVSKTSSMIGNGNLSSQASDSIFCSQCTFSKIHLFLFTITIGLAYSEELGRIMPSLSHSSICLFTSCLSVKASDEEVDRLVLRLLK